MELNPHPVINIGGLWNQAVNILVPTRRAHYERELANVKPTEKLPNPSKKKRLNPSVIHGMLQWKELWEHIA